MSEEREIWTVLGVFEKNKLVDQATGEIIDCVSYNSLRKKMEGKLCVHNLRYNTYNDATVFQSVILDEPIQID